MRRIIIFCTILVFLAVQFASATSHIEQMVMDGQIKEDLMQYMKEMVIKKIELQLYSVGYTAQDVDIIINYYITNYIKSARSSESGTNQIPPIEIIIPIPGWLAAMLIVGFILYFIIDEVLWLITCGFNDHCKDVQEDDNILPGCYQLCCGSKNNCYAPERDLCVNYCE